MLSACSSGKSPAGTGPGTPASVQIGRFTQMFAGPLPASPVRARIVEDFRQGQVLWNKSLSDWHLVPSVRDYVTGQALTDLTRAMSGGKAHDYVPAGVDRLFMTRVTAAAGTSATVTTCDDASRFKQENPRTGKVDTSFQPMPQENYLSEAWRMVRRGGHWAITGLSISALPSYLALSCQPGMASASRPDAAALLQKMNAALASARSVHISGTVLQGGKTVGVDLSVTRAGAASGEVSEGGALVTIRVAHGLVYLKLNAAFLKLSHLPASACVQVCGNYVELPAGQAQTERKGLNMKSLMSSLTGTVVPPVSYAGTGTVSGEPAWLLLDSRGDLVYVASHGTPYLLEIIGSQSSADVASLSQWNAVRIPVPPPASQIVSLGQLTA